MAHEHQTPPGDELPPPSGQPQREDATPPRIRDQASGEGSDSALERMRELDKRKASSDPRDERQWLAGT